MLTPKSVNELKEPCPKCGRRIGFIYLRRWNRKKNAIRVEKDFRGNEIRIPIKSRRMKLTNVTYRSNMVTDEISRLENDLEILRNLLPKIYRKYPSIITLKPFLKEGIEALRTHIKPMVDDRWKLGWLQWNKLIQDAEEYGYHAAASRFKNAHGKKISVQALKNKREKLTDYQINLTLFIPFLGKICNALWNMIDNDEELRNYTEKKDEEIENKLLQNRLNGDTTEENYDYEYYYVIHYDAKQYRNQKAKFLNGKRKSKPDGKIRCGPFLTRPL
jgi:hypothetical protein